MLIKGDIEGGTLKIININRAKKIEPLFGLRVPDFVYSLYKICISQEAFEKAFKEYLNMNPKRLIKIVEAVEGEKQRSVLLVVIYDKIVEGKSMLKDKLRTKVQDFNFPIFVLGINEQTDIEEEIEEFKRRRLL